MHRLILSLPKDEEGQRPVSKPHPEEPRSGVSKDDGFHYQRTGSQGP